MTCLLSAGCGVSGDDEAADSSTTVVATASDASSTTADATTTTTTEPSTTTTTTPRTTTTTATATTVPAYGSSCVLGSHPDCIDPEGDGQGTFLQGGAACMAEMAPTLGPGICTDLDGDGRAGYPDAG